MDELIQIVDENDAPLRAGTKQIAWKDGSYHRIVRIHVEDENKNILLQKRNDKMPTYPSCWDNAAAGHVDAEETYRAAALRELYEELGIKGYDLKEAVHYRTQGNYEGKILNRFVTLYTLQVPHDISIRPQESEVAATKWFTRDELKELIDHHADLVSDGLVEVFQRLYA